MNLKFISNSQLITEHHKAVLLFFLISDIFLHTVRAGHVNVKSVNQNILKAYLSFSVMLSKDAVESCDGGVKCVKGFSWWKES